MATITANIKTTTQTKPWPAVFAIFGLILALSAIANMTGSMAPFAKLNDRIVDELARAPKLDTGARLELLSTLRLKQEKALAGKPAEPFAWARLAYFRAVTQNDTPGAFAALRLSDLVSPDEPRQLPERAFMWRQLRQAEDKDEQAYQATLWQKAYRMQPDVTWAIAKQNGITDEVGAAIKSVDLDLYEQWKARAAAKP